MAHNFIKKAIKHPGALHRALGVPEGEKIPQSKLTKAAAHAGPHMKKMLALAKTLKGLHH